MRKLPWLISVLRLITGTGIPEINHEAQINRNVEAVGTGGIQPGYPGYLGGRPVPI
jgi:hypothetical protein